jgi:hypothetical protein
MPLTRDFKATIQERASRDARFREALLKEAVDASSSPLDYLRCPTALGHFRLRIPEIGKIEYFFRPHIAGDSSQPFAALDYDLLQPLWNGPVARDGFQVIVVNTRHEFLVLVSRELHDCGDALLTVCQIDTLPFYCGAHKATHQVALAGEPLVGGDDRRLNVFKMVRRTQQHRIARVLG